jgi:Bacterial TniB protein
MTREERIAKIRGGRWIRYPLADRIGAKLEELLLLPKTHRMPNLAKNAQRSKTVKVWRP